MTIRLRLTIRYDGTDLHGWARQQDLRTVEGEIQWAFETVVQAKTDLVVAGRTDAGVHASAQIAHVDLDEKKLNLSSVGDAPQFDEVAAKRLQDRLNALLATRYSKRLRPQIEAGLLPRHVVVKGESDILITQINQVNQDFDARFSALQRHYCYRLADTISAKDPLRRRDTWWIPFKSVDLGLMKEAARHLVGDHDFLSFCRPREGATTIRTLRQIEVSRSDCGTVAIRVAADAFCHSMVRSLVGALVEVGRQARDVQWVEQLVLQPSRSHGVPVAPARGLTLVGVTYPHPEEWAAQSLATRRRRDEPQVKEG